MQQSSLSRDQVAARGEEMYESQIRPLVERQFQGMYLAIDVDSGEYEVAGEDLIATKRLLARCPQAVVYGLRIGHPAAYRLGGVRKAGDA